MGPYAPAHGRRRHHARTYSRPPSRISGLDLRRCGFSPRLIDRVWVAARCIHLNSQQISRMPLRFFGSREPAWVSNPDPVWFPNGIGDAVYAAIDSMYRWGDAYLYVTARYQDGYPVGLDGVERREHVHRGRERAVGSTATASSTSTPRTSSRSPAIPRGICGTSAIKSYSAQAYGLMAASDLGRVMMESGTPNAVLQAEAQARRGAGGGASEPVDQRNQSASGRSGRSAAGIEFQQLSFSARGSHVAGQPEVQRARSSLLRSGFRRSSSTCPSRAGSPTSHRPCSASTGGASSCAPRQPHFLRPSRAQMLPRGSYVEFDARDTLAPTFKELVEAWVAMAEAGLVSGEELRAAVLRLPPQEQQEVLEALTTPPSAGRVTGTATAGRRRASPDELGNKLLGGKI